MHHKYIVIVGDGMADDPIEALGGLTPIQAAHSPWLDRLACEGRTGLLQTIPAGFSPGSEIANLSLLGYDVASVFEGRGSLEAASMGITIGADEMAMRCNLITIDNGLIRNHSAGHISTEEARELIRFLDEKLGGGPFHFYPGVSYRHLLKMKGGDKGIICTPPHDVLGASFGDLLIRPESPQASSTAELLNRLIFASQALLANHPVNLRRREKGQDAANSIWPWSPGYRPQMETLLKKYHLHSGSVISAVDLIKGIGIYAGLKPVEVEGATGLYDTNYEGKAKAAMVALRHDDFVFLHIEASDEASHEGDVALKVKTIEYLDRRIVGPIYQELSKWDTCVTIAVLPDHPTPCRLRTHTADPVPFLIWNRERSPDCVACYDEFQARQGFYGVLQEAGFMEALFEKP